MSITDDLRDFVFYEVNEEETADKLIDLADDIDEAYVRLLSKASLPRDMNGDPCYLDDIVWHKGDKYLVVAVSHKGMVNIREFDKRNSGKGAVWVNASEVFHKEPDGWEKIVGDAVVAPEKYCKKHDLLHHGAYNAEKVKALHLVSRCSALVS